MLAARNNTKTFIDYRRASPVIGILFLILQLLLTGFFLFLCLAFVTGGPFVPSNQKSVTAMVKLARIKPGQTVIDVGSGDGRVLLEAAKQGANAIGVEINPYLVWFTQLRAFLSPYRGRITAVWGNLWTSDLRAADVVFVYLIPWKMDVLAKKLREETKPGTLIVSNTFIFPHWKIVRKDVKHHIYAFTISAQK